MEIQHLLHHYLPLVSSQSAAEIDGEIREELEFHLDMRTQDNLRAGMSSEEARRDAQQRFGDFEENRAACRRITLGPRLMFARLQTAVIVVLIGAVVYEGMLLFKLQTSSRAQIESLSQLVAELQAATQLLRNESALIPYAQFSRELPDGVVDVTDSANTNDLVDWRTKNPLRQPWSDWQPLDGSPK